MAKCRYDRSTFTFFAVAAFSLSTTLISTAIVTRLAVKLTTIPHFSLVVTASAFEVFNLLALVAAVGLFLRRVSPGLLLAAWVSGAAFCSVGTLLALGSLGLTNHYARRNVLEASLQDEARDLAVVGLTITVLGLIPQTAFYTLIWPQSKRHHPCTVETQDRPSFADSQKHHLSALSPVRTNLFRSTREPALHRHSSYRSAAGACPKCPARYGLQPMSSKTRLLSIHSRADSATVSEPARANSDFENWDTSAVEAFDHPSFSQKTFLEPIPGSRPVSPANPLDGPFYGEGAEPEEIPLPDTPPHPSSEDCGASFRTFRRPSQHEELYYHPLFRGESPAPPLTSPGTVITASPFAGEVVSPELVAPRILHSAASSRPASPGLLSPARSHAGSIRSLRTVPTSPAGPLSPLEPVYLVPSQLAGHNPSC